MVAILPRRLPRGPLRRGRAGRWPEEPIYLLTVVAGLALLVLSTRTFHKRAAERSDALQQLRAAQESRATQDGSGTPVGLNLARRRSGAASASSSSRVSSTAAKVDHGSREQEPRQLHEEQAQEQGKVAALSEFHAQATVDASRNEQAATAGSAGQQAATVGSARQQAAKQELQRYCEEHFGLDWLRRWGATARQVCSASRQLSLGEAAGSATGAGAHNEGGMSGGSGAGSGVWRAPSAVTCRSMNDTHMPAGSAPHVLCDATNLRLDPSKLRRARCPVHRPGYMCTSPTYHHYERGAWAVDCAWPGFRLDAFSKDHQQDIFGSLVSQPELGSAGGAAQALQASPGDVEELPTLFVTREVAEHANVYHTMTDLLNVFVTLRMLGWEHQPRQVVMLDAHRPGPLDILWPVAAAGGGPAALAMARELEAQGFHAWEARAPAAGSASSRGTGSRQGQHGGRLLVRRVEDLKAPTLFRHAAFVPPGYTSLLFAHLYEDASCPLPTRLFAGFRRFMLASFGLNGRAAEGGADGMDLGSGGTAAGAASSSDGSASLVGGSSGGSNGGSGTLVIRLISRRPGKGKPKMARQIGNKEELLAALRALGEEWSREGSGGSGDGSGHDALSVSVSLLDFAKLTVEQQLAVVQQADILIGMHGAALAHALLLPPHAALVELWPQADGIWRCYQNFAQWAGALYRRVANRDPSRHRNTPRGDVTDVDAAALTQAVRELLPLVAARRAATAGGGGSRLGGAGAVQQQDEVEELPPRKRTTARAYRPPSTMGLFGFNLSLKDQLVFYGSYHSNPLNQLIHFIFVPAIWWTVAVWLAYTPPAFSFDLAPHLPECCASLAQHLQFNGSFFLAAAYSAYYLLLEPLAGLSWAGLVALPLWGLANWFRAAVPSAWAWALGLHLFSWFAQIVFGHQMAEGRKPALLDSFFQSLVLAPLFVWFELLWRLGYRRGLRAEVEGRVQSSIEEWRRATTPLVKDGDE
ncbi:hypothetical protein ABPG75_005345 [Micractinium tetrahymenae]